MKVAIIPVTPFQQNCSLLVCTQSNKAAVVDPGGDLDRILDAVKAQGVELEKILLTHGHLDHCGGTAELSKELGLPVEGPHIDDRFLIDNLPQQSLRFGLPQLEAFTPARWLLGGDTVRFGQVELQVRHCPGHTPGHVIFFSSEYRLALSPEAAWGLASRLFAQVRRKSVVRQRLSAINDLHSPTIFTNTRFFRPPSNSP